MANESKDPAKIVTSTHRLSYVHLKEPKAFEDEKPKYSVTILIPKDHPDVAKIEKTIKALYQANADNFKGIKMTSKNFNYPLRDGDEYFEEHPENPEYEGMMYIKSSSVSRPQLFDADKNEIFDAEEIYSGCFARASLKFFAYWEKGKGVSSFLNSVMFIKDGERFGSSNTADPDDFDEEDETDFEDLI